MIEKGVVEKFGREAKSNFSYTLNQVQHKKGKNKTSYEIWYDKKPNVRFFNVFGSKCYVLKDDRNGKFDKKERKEYF